jgi:hypothetical protein
VAKIASSALIWVTKRISWDGIMLRRIEDDVVFGSWYDVSNSGNEWQPLRLDYATGRIIEGQEIKF